MLNKMEVYTNCVLSQEEGIYETENCVVFFVRLPNAKKEDIDLEMDDHKLAVKIKGKKKLMKSDKEIVPERASATFKDDILRVEVPKKNKEEQE